MSAADLHIATFRLLCIDPRRLATFYGDAFGAVTQEGPDGVTVAIGGQRIEFVETSGRAGVVARANANSFQHLALVVADMGGAHAVLLRTPGWAAISQAGPERLPASSGGVEAFKFRDPEGHPLELLAFPRGGVPSAWAGAAGLVLGIDHSAITVGDTERAVAFYAMLGFTVASRGLNAGPEQARLDGVPAPVVEVTGLMPPGGAPPHLELLRYRSPATVSEPLADDDPLATRIVLDAQGRSGPVGMVCDPDGHRLVLPARDPGDSVPDEPDPP